MPFTEKVPKTSEDVQHDVPTPSKPDRKKRRKKIKRKNHNEDIEKELLRILEKLSEEYND